MPENSVPYREYFDDKFKDLENRISEIGEDNKTMLNNFDQRLRYLEKQDVQRKTIAEMEVKHQEEQSKIQAEKISRNSRWIQFLIGIVSASGVIEGWLHFVK